MIRTRALKCILTLAIGLAGNTSLAQARPDDPCRSKAYTSENFGTVDAEMMRNRMKDAGGSASALVASYRDAHNNYVYDAKSWSKVLKGLSAQEVAKRRAQTEREYAIAKREEPQVRALAECMEANANPQGAVPVRGDFSYMAMMKVLESASCPGDLGIGARELDAIRQVLESSNFGQAKAELVGRVDRSMQPGLSCRIDALRKLRKE